MRAGSGAQGIDTLGVLDLGKAAKLLSDLTSVVEEGQLSRMQVIAREAEFVEDARSRITSQAQVFLISCSCTHNIHPGTQKLISELKSNEATDTRPFVFILRDVHDRFLVEIDKSSCPEECSSPFFPFILEHRSAGIS